mgnify:CR=1 FL=1
MRDYLSVTTVIFDGECDFCRSCIEWVQNRYQIQALANQSIDPVEYGVTREQCEKSVIVIENQILVGAKAVAYLLKKTEHRYLGKLLKLLGPLGEYGYKYVASHREGKLVALLHWFIKKNK